MPLDCVMPDVFSRALVRARKAHACCECGAPILPGEEYYLAEGLWEGRWERYKTCSCCEKKRCALADYFKAECIAFGELHEYYHAWERDQLSTGAALARL
jgi:hypothetical protein